jgi:hypothetical protein
LQQLFELFFVCSDTTIVSNRREKTKKASAEIPTHVVTPKKIRSQGTDLLLSD